MRRTRALKTQPLAIEGKIRLGILAAVGKLLDVLDVPLLGQRQRRRHVRRLRRASLPSRKTNRRGNSQG